MLELYIFIGGLEGLEAAVLSKFGLSIISKNIANHLGVTPQTINPTLKTLEFSGLLSSRRGAIKRGEPSGGKRSENLAFDR
jgi:hypothetical protein